MKDASLQLLEKASRSLEAAVALLDLDHIEFAVGRAYYAMFYAAEALLNEKELRFSKHSGVHSAFGKHFIKTGILDAKYHRWLLNAFDRRIAGDYSVDISFELEEAREVVEQAGEFVDEARRYLEISNI